MPAASSRSALGPRAHAASPVARAGRPLALYVPGIHEGHGANNTPQCRDRVGTYPRIDVPTTTLGVKNLPRGFLCPESGGVTAPRGMHAALRADQQRQRPLSMLWVGRFVPGSGATGYACFGGITFDRTGGADYGVCEMQQWTSVPQNITFIATVSNNTTRYLFGCSTTESAVTYAAAGLLNMTRGETFAVSIVLEAGGHYWMHANGIVGADTAVTGGQHTQNLRWGANSGPFIGRYGTHPVYGGNIETYALYMAAAAWPRRLASDLTRHPEALWSGARSGLLTESGAQILSPIVDISAGSWFVQGV